MKSDLQALDQHGPSECEILVKVVIQRGELGLRRRRANKNDDEGQQQTRKGKDADELF